MCCTWQLLNCFASHLKHDMRKIIIIFCIPRQYIVLLNAIYKKLEKCQSIFNYCFWSQFFVRL